MKKVLITGATGMVGSQVLQCLLTHPNVKEVLSIGRRKTGIAHPKLTEVVHQDFNDFSGLNQELVSVDICFYCLATYQNQVESKEKYLEITCDYQKALTDILAQSSPKATFVLFSAAGADSTEKSRITFAKAKGQAENLLKETVFPKKYIFRPGIIHPTGSRRPTSWDYRFLQPLYSLIFKIAPVTGVSDQELAKAMVNVGLPSQMDSQTFENKAIRQYIHS